MIPRVDPPRLADDLICGRESDSEQEYGDRMDALEAEERLSRHYDFTNFAPLDATASPASTGGEARRSPAPAQRPAPPSPSGAGRQLASEAA